MENNNRPIRHERQQRLNRTERSTTSESEELVPFRRPEPKSPTPPKQEHSPTRDDRSFYGFDDIPVDDEDMDNVRFADILKAWGKRSVQHSPIEKYLKSSKAKKKHLKQLSNDLKWALQADLDEPVAPRPKQPKKHEAPKQSPSSPLAQSSPEQKTIDINISFGSLPKLPSPKKGVASLFDRAKKLRPRLQKPLAAKVIGVIAVVIVGTSAWLFIPGSPGAISNTPSAPASGSGTSPTYATVLPDGKSAESLGGWSRVSPNDRDPVYAYKDKINDITINVSQQPLPSIFKKDTDIKISELAKSYGATSKIESGSDTIYIGSSAQGPQSAILAKNDTLILMKSTQKIPDDAWSSYVKSLK